MYLIRPAETFDWKSIKKVANGLGYESVSNSEAHRWLEAVLALEDQRVWVGEVGGKVIGWLHALRAVKIASPPVIELVGLIVEPHHRRQGVGRNLVNEAITWAALQNLGVRVRCNSRRAQSHLFYESLGFINIKSQIVFEYDL